jgi:uncharacterized membrane protein
MNMSFYQLIWYFFIYGFFGWCLEIVYGAIRQKHFLNRGFLNGPLCPIYGICMVACLTFFSSLEEGFLFLIIGCGVIATILEFFAGAILERLFQKKWWDYSDYKYTIGGYVCLPISALWGLLAALTLRYFHPLIHTLIEKFPVLPGRILLIIAVIILAADGLSVMGIVFHVQKYDNRVEAMAKGMNQISNRLGRAIFTRIQRRMTKAYPALTAAELSSSTSSAVFAEGCSFHKLVWLFMISAFLGDIIEMIFCYVTSGVLMSRSSVVYGTFSIVWGLGVVVLTMMLHKYRDREDRYIFLFGTVVGGAYEYICSVFTELVFGTVFWDYSKIPFNLGGRINLLYCFFWGVAAVVWIKIIYPFLSGLIERIPKKAGSVLSYCFLMFMAVNIVVSGAALGRYAERKSGIPAENSIEVMLDDRFHDQRMERIYPNAIVKQ